MDLKKLEKDNKTTYYTLGWLFKHIIIVGLSSVPAFLWAFNRGDSNSFGMAILITLGLFVVAFIADLLRKVTNPEAIISDGALDMLRKKIYWSIGPQFIAILFTYILIFITSSIIAEKSNIDVFKNSRENMADENKPSLGE